MKNFLIHHRVKRASIMKSLNYGALLALVLIASIGSLQAAPTKITASQTITIPGSYVLANDITGGIGIQASDVILNLNEHTITTQGGISIGQFDTGGLPLVNVRVSNGQIIATSGGTAVAIFGSSCLITGLKITVGLAPIPGFGFGGTAIEIEHGNFNRVHSCIITGQGGAIRLRTNLGQSQHNPK
jgi:hypothetical protein